jgi:hypothetical protein
MPGKKSRRGSTEIQKAEVQLATIKRIDPNLQLGQGDSPQTYEDAIAEAHRELIAYHEAAEALETRRIALKAAEKKVKSITVKILAAIALAFGKESPQYSMVGGVRPSEIKRNGNAKKDDEQNN